MTFDEIRDMLGFEIDNSFSAKELLAHGHRMGKLSMKNRTVAFERLKSAGPALRS